MSDEKYTVTITCSSEEQVYELIEKIIRLSAPLVEAKKEDKDEEDNSWDTECEDLVLEGELACQRMDETRKRAEEKMAAAVKAAEEAEEAELEAEEAEKNYKRNSEQLQEVLDKKKKKKIKIT